MRLRDSTQIKEYSDQIIPDLEYSVEESSSDPLFSGISAMIRDRIASELGVSRTKIDSLVQKYTDTYVYADGSISYLKSSAPTFKNFAEQHISSSSDDETVTQPTQPEPVNCNDYKGKDLDPSQVPAQCHHLLAPEDQPVHIMEKSGDKSGTGDSGISTQVQKVKEQVLSGFGISNKTAMRTAGVLGLAGIAYWAAKSAK